MSHIRSMIAALGVAVGLTAVAGLVAPAKAEAADAKKLWKTKCASCHGAEGKADTDTGKEQGVRDLTTEAWQKEFDDAKIKAAIETGLKREKDGKKQDMKAFKDKLKPEEIDELVKLIRGLKK